MAEMILTAGPICRDLPCQTDGASLHLIEDAAFSIVAPFAGQHAAASRRLQEVLGEGLPEVGGSGAKLQWFAGGQWAALAQAALLTETLAGIAAVTDQTDGWCGFALRGANAVPVMARLCPLDFRETSMPPGRVARTEFCHMMAHVLRRSDGFDLRVMRSFAETAETHIRDAMNSIAAQLD